MVEILTMTSQLVSFESDDWFCIPICGCVDQGRFLTTVLSTHKMGIKRVYTLED
jgi:hypothetical protein